MSELQHEHYDGSTEINSDPIGLWNRDNRNHRKKQQLILEKTHANTGDEILEVGCGHGLHAPRYDTQFHYTGVDLSESLIAAARERPGLTSAATFHQMDAMDLAYPDDSFAAVVGTAVLHHLADQEDALREWKRVTKPGGSVTLMEPNYLFPKDFITAHTVPEEQHKTGMAPWRLRRTLSAVDDAWELSPHIYTPPWPARFAEVYDTLDAIGSRTPGVRWLSQMLRIHIAV